MLNDHGDGALDETGVQQVMRQVTASGHWLCTRTSHAPDVHVDPGVYRHSPRMELPPLSPGIHDNVIDVLVVLVTVRRG